MTVRWTDAFISSTSCEAPGFPITEHFSNDENVDKSLFQARATESLVVAKLPYKFQFLSHFTHVVVNYHISVFIEDVATVGWGHRRVGPP